MSLYLCTCVGSIVCAGVVACLMVELSSKPHSFYNIVEIVLTFVTSCTNRAKDGQNAKENGEME